MRAFAVVMGTLDDLVVDVGDIADIGDLVGAVDALQGAVDHIEHHQDPGMAQMAVVVDGHAADIHAHVVGVDGAEGLFLLAQAVIDLQHSGFLTVLLYTYVEYEIWIPCACDGASRTPAGMLTETRGHHKTGNAGEPLTSATNPLLLAASDLYGRWTWDT
jgi:hypothetical protein